MYLTDKELLQYKSIKTEISDLEDRIEKMKKPGTIMMGKVKGSSKFFPFVERTFSISGIDPDIEKVNQRALIELLKQRETRLAELIKKEKEIEDFINSIHDSTDRIIMRLYYIDGETQERISKKLGYEQPAVSKRISKCLKMEC